MTAELEKCAHDKKGYPVYEGDVLKVFHFIGQRNKKYFMYKVVIASPRGFLAFCISDLALKGRINAHSCPLDALGDFEIVQGYGPEPFVSWEDRPRQISKELGKGES